MTHKILVVDNNPVILKLMTNFLIKGGHRVKTAEDGLAALEVIKSFQPEIIFVDLIMPRIPGEKLCKILRQKKELRQTVIIILSAAAVEQKINFKEFGADACIAKGPFKEIERHIQLIFKKLAEGGLPALGNNIIGTDKVYKRIVTSELLSSRRHFWTTLNNMAEGFIELTEDGRIVYINQVAAEIIGQPEEELLASDFLDIFDQKQKTEMSELLVNISSEAVTIGEHEIFKFQNRYLTITLVALNDEDEDKSIIVIIHDITRRKEAEFELQRYQENLELIIERRTAELKERNRELQDEIEERRRIAREKEILEAELRQTHKMEAIGTMAAGIAHDFNNLLTSIFGYTELLSLPSNIPAESLPLLQNIIKAASRARELITLIQTFSKPEKQEFSEVRLPIIIAETLSLLRPSIPRHIKLTTDIKPCRPIMGSAVQIQQVLLNICTNAIHAMQEGGGILSIKLGIPHPADRKGKTELIELEISDTGLGISKENLEKIFDPYFTTHIGGEGTGLGLSVVHGIIRHHGGSITVNSTEGQGTTFTVSLPASPS
ncbi:ATP-binding protein [Desulfobacterota bacterium M19]